MLARVGCIALMATACGGGSFNTNDSNPLVGSWTTATTSGMTTYTETVDVSPDGSLSVSLTTGGASCSGTLTNTGYTWTSTATTVTVSGTATCSGSITCGALSYDCSASKPGVTAGSCDYSLTNGNDTLALTGCTGISNATFTRVK